MLALYRLLISFLTLEMTKATLSVSIEAEDSYATDAPDSVFQHWEVSNLSIFIFQFYTSLLFRVLCSVVFVTKYLSTILPSLECNFSFPVY